MKNIIILLTGILLLTSCKSLTNCQIEKEIDKEYVYKTDTVKIVDVKRDSIFLKDSVSFIMRNDTVFINKYVTKYVEKSKLDTIYRNHTDTICKTDSIYVDKIITKEQKLSFNKRFGMFAFDFLIVLVVIILFKFRKGL